MDTFHEFRAYGQLSEDLIADATKDDLVEVARILAMQAAHYARKYGELPIPDLTHLLTNRQMTKVLPCCATEQSPWLEYSGW